MQPHTARRNIRLLYAFWFLRDFHLWIPVWIVFLTEQRGFSLTEVTGAEGLYLVGVVFLEVPTGAVADRWGRSKSLALGALCLAGATFIFAFTESFGVLLVSFLLWSVAFTLTWNGVPLAAWPAVGVQVTSPVPGSMVMPPGNRVSWYVTRPGSLLLCTS